MRKIQYLTLGLISLLAVACGDKKSDSTSTSTTENESSGKTEVAEEAPGNANDASEGASKVATEVTLQVKNELGELSNYLKFYPSITLKQEGNRIKGALTADVLNTFYSQSSLEPKFDLEIVDEANILIEDYKYDLKIKGQAINGSVPKSGYRYKIEQGKNTLQFDGSIDNAKWSKIVNEGTYVLVKLHKNSINKLYLPEVENVPSETSETPTISTIYIDPDFVDEIQMQSLELDMTDEMDDF